MDAQLSQALCLDTAEEGDLTVVARPALATDRPHHPDRGRAPFMECDLPDRSPLPLPPRFDRRRRGCVLYPDLSRTRGYTGTLFSTEFRAGTGSQGNRQLPQRKEDRA